MISGIAFDRADQSSESYDRFKIYTDRTQFYPSDRGRLSRPARLRSSP